MRVLHVVQRYWPYTGGSERHIQEISERLAEEGHAVTVYTTDAFDLELFWNPRKRRIAVSREVHNGVEILRFPVRHLPVPRWSYPAVRWTMTNLSTLPVDTVPLLRRLTRLAPRVPDLFRALDARGEYDVVHGMNICFDGLLWPALEFARRIGAAFVITPLIHLGEDHDDRVRKYYTMRHQLELVSRSDAVLAQTDIERNYLIARGVPADKIVKAGVGVNPDAVLGGDGERFRAKYRIYKPFVFYAGTAAYDKGTFHLIEAMKLLWEEGIDADLVLAGPTMDGFTEFYERQPSTVKQRCHVLQFIPEEDKRDLFAAGLVLVMPSRTDSFGIVYLEAWLYGKPVIGARAGGVPSVIDDGRDGFLVQFGDVSGLASRLRQLLADPQLARGLGEHGRRKVLARYTWDHIYPVVREVYERVWRKRETTLAVGIP